MAATQVLIEGALEKKYGKGRLGASFKERHILLAWKDGKLYLAAKDHKEDKTAKEFLVIDDGTVLETGRSEKGKFRFDVTTPSEVMKAMTAKHHGDQPGVFQLCAETEGDRTRWLAELAKQVAAMNGGKAPTVTPTKKESIAQDKGKRRSLGTCHSGLKALATAQSKSKGESLPTSGVYITRADVSYGPTSLIQVTMRFF